MRKMLLIAAAACVAGGGLTGAVIATAQPAPPPPEAVDAPPAPPHGPMMGWWNRMHHHRPMPLRTFALVYPQADRNLSPADVQKIAEAFLLWRGNHTWKVTDVAPTSDGTVGFSLSTPEGSVIAKFTMDPHSGRLTRVS